MVRNTIQPLASVGGGFTPADYGIRDQSGTEPVVDDNELFTGAEDHIRLEGSVNTTLGWLNHAGETITVSEDSTSGTVTESRPS